MSDISEFDIWNRFADAAVKILPRSYKVVGSVAVERIYAVPDGEHIIVTLGGDDHPLQVQSIIGIQQRDNFQVGSRHAIILQHLLAPICPGIVLQKNFYVGPKELLQEGAHLDEHLLLFAEPARRNNPLLQEE